MSDSIARPRAYDRKIIESILNPKTRVLLDSRFLKVEWLRQEPHDPWLELRVYRLSRVGVHFHAGKFYARWAPRSKKDWAEAKAQGKTGARNRNRLRAQMGEWTVET